MSNNGLLNLVLGLALAIMIGWLLYVGRSIMVPVVIALIVAYVMTAADQFLASLPGVAALPAMLRRVIVLAVFTLAFIGLALVVVVTVRDLVAIAPTYEARLETMIVDIAATFHIETHPTWADIRRTTLDQFDFQSLLVGLLGSVSSFGSMFFIVMVYAAFLLGERGGFAARVYSAFPQRDDAERAIAMLHDINRQVGDYLAIKTLINIILATVSYAILWSMGVDFALFWAIFIGLLNYIPYVGSLLGVLFPVVLSVAQFGSLQSTALLAALLITAQTFVGNFLEPRWIGSQLNLSPFVVLLALSIWSTLWGLHGAILAVPMTSVMVIVFRSFDSTRFIAILLAQRMAAPATP